jgi:hypothetical protein
MFPPPTNPTTHPDGTLRGLYRRPRLSAPWSRRSHPGNLEDSAWCTAACWPRAPNSAACFWWRVNRGCGRGCRFCAAGFVYRPLRHRSLAGLEPAWQEGLASGAKIGLVGTAVTDHPDLKEILRRLTAAGAQVGLSSLRADCADAELFALLKQGGVKSVALAPEAGSDRLRRVINKNLTTNRPGGGGGLALQGAGLSQLRLYFLVGLPTETRDDVAEIARSNQTPAARAPSRRQPAAPVWPASPSASIPLCPNPLPPCSGCRLPAWPSSRTGSNK